MVRRPRQRLLYVALGVCTVMLAGRLVYGQSADPIGLPRGATSIEGTPTQRVEVTADNTTRHRLTATEAAARRLRIQIKDGGFYWSADDQMPLSVTSSGAFTYLASNEPGRYVRISRVNDRLTYVEHVDAGPASVTYWGELRIIVGR